MARLNGMLQISLQDEMTPTDQPLQNLIFSVEKMPGLQNPMVPASWIARAIEAELAGPLSFSEKDMRDITALSGDRRAQIMAIARLVGPKVTKMVDGPSVLRGPEGWATVVHPDGRIEDPVVLTEARLEEIGALIRTDIDGKRVRREYLRDAAPEEPPEAETDYSRLAKLVYGA